MPPRIRNSMQQRLQGYIVRACDVFEDFPESVTFIGSQSLFNNDGMCVTARNAACELAKAGTAMLTGDGGPVFKACMPDPGKRIHM